MRDLFEKIKSTRGLNDELKSTWTLENDGFRVQVNLKYSMKNLLSTKTKDSIEVTVIGALKQTSILTKENPSMKLILPDDANYFGIKGVITADFEKSIVYYEGNIDTGGRSDWNRCPPPRPFRLPIFSIPTENFYTRKDL